MIEYEKGVFMKQFISNLMGILCLSSLVVFFKVITGNFEFLPILLLLLIVSVITVSVYSKFYLEKKEEKRIF